ncbi:hypothetical protein Tco_1397644 [Tanacetum coccineum]
MLLQEEGWVVCRAFKKPTPIQPWNNGYHIRNTNNFMALPPISDTAGSNPSQSFFVNQARNSKQLLLGDIDQRHSANHFLHEHSNIDSPSASRSLATNEDLDYESGINSNLYDSDWKNITNLLESELDKPTPFPDSTMPLIAYHNELDSRDQPSHLFGCFTDL